MVELEIKTRPIILGFTIFWGSSKKSVKHRSKGRMVRDLEYQEEF